MSQASGILACDTPGATSDAEACSAPASGRHRGGGQIGVAPHTKAVADYECPVTRR